MRRAHQHTRAGVTIPSFLDQLLDEPEVRKLNHEGRGDTRAGVGRVHVVYSQKDPRLCVLQCIPGQGGERDGFGSKVDIRGDGREQI